MSINNILILDDNNFVNKEEEVVRNIKIIIKDQKYHILAQQIKFNWIQIKLDSNGIVLTKMSYLDAIFLVTDHDIDSTSSKAITRKKLLPKKYYLA